MESFSHLPYLLHPALPWTVVSFKLCNMDFLPFLALRGLYSRKKGRNASEQHRFWATLLPSIPTFEQLLPQQLRFRATPPTLPSVTTISIHYLKRHHHCFNKQSRTWYKVSDSASDKNEKTLSDVNASKITCYPGLMYTWTSLLSWMQWHDALGFQEEKARKLCFLILLGGTWRDQNKIHEDNQIRR